MKSLLLSILAIISFCAVSNAQSLSPQVISTAGDYFSAPGVGSLSWTLGEPVIETFTASGQGVILTQGFQQPEDFSVGISEIKPGNIFANLYPNPAVDNVRLDVIYDRTAQLNMQMVDLLGRVLYESDMDVFNGQQQSYDIDISNLAAGMYLIRISDNGQVVDTYRIQKATL